MSTGWKRLALHELCYQNQRETKQSRADAPDVQKGWRSMFAPLLCRPCVVVDSGYLGTLQTYLRRIWMDVVD